MNTGKLLKGVRLPRPGWAPGPPVGLPAPLKVYLALAQHQGEICEPLVEPGQQVQLGQPVAANDQTVIHATVSGQVEGIVTLPGPDGAPVATMVIKNDGHDTWAENEGPLESAMGLTTVGGEKPKPSQVLAMIKAAGLVKASVAGRPLHQELSPPETPRSFLFTRDIPVMEPLDTLIVRAVDPDPPVTPNQALWGEVSPEFEVGVAGLAHLLGVHKVFVVAPAGKTSSALADLCYRKAWRMVEVDENHYPFMTDNLLVHQLTGRAITFPHGETLEEGVVVLPLANVLDAGHVFLNGRPPVERVFTVAGDVAKPGNYRVRIGTPVAEVLAAAGGATGESGKVLLGGPMRGLAHFDLATPVTKQTAGLYVQAADKMSHFEDLPCIHCGRCVQACPVNLVPGELSKFCEYEKYEDAAARDLMYCIECGCCAYVCPSRRPMVHLFRLGKKEILQARRAAENE